MTREAQLEQRLADARARIAELEGEVERARADERERAAQIADKHAADLRRELKEADDDGEKGMILAGIFEAQEIAAAIRERGEGNG